MTSSADRMDQFPGDPMPSFAMTKIARELQRATAKGRICSECGTQFVKSHGKPVACVFCWARLPLAEQRCIAKATHEEANRLAHINEARKRKARKQ